MIDSTRMGIDEVVALVLRRVDVLEGRWRSLRDKALGQTGPRGTREARA
mgnify:CR=1 FL=1